MNRVRARLAAARVRSALLLAAACSAAAVTSAFAQVKAFPEAEGFGRYATGARTNLAAASVYHVTNLNDAGPGSFRDAVSQPNRFVVFDVSGVARLNSAVAVQDNVTIAAQTAPGGGFTLYGAKVSFTGADNTIARYLRVRKGSASGRDDAVSLARGQNMMFDHMSVTWGVDETFSMNPDSGYTIDNISIQNSIIGQGLDVVNHSAGGLMTINGKFSVLRSLFIDNETRNPKVRGTNQFVNNVVYNWTTAAYIMGDTSATSNANIEGNYLIQGPQQGGSPFSSGTSSFHLYANNNLYDSNRNGVLDGSPVTSYPGADLVATPHDMPKVATDTPQAAYARILAKVGPSLYRDEVDTRMLEELASLGTLGQIVIRESDLYPNYPAQLPSPAKPTDTDNDGIPDAWETAHGLNPANGSDWKTLGHTGYTRLEEYINELASVHTDKSWNAAAGTWPTAGNWAGGTGGAPTWDEDAFVRGNGPGTNGNVTVADPNAAAFRLYVGGNGDAAGGEKVTVSNGGSLTVMDTIHVGHDNKGTLEINAGGTVEATNVLLGNVVGGTTYAGTINLNGGTLKAGRIVSLGGAGSAININGGTLVATANPVFSAPATLGPAGGSIDTAGFSGTFAGSISGTGALTKKGEGTLDLTGTNTFTGGVKLEGGSLGASSDANLGGPTSSIHFGGGLLRINGTSMTTLGAHPINFATFDGGFDIAAAGNTFSVPQNIGGSGSVTKAGAGTLVLGGTNSYTGGTVVQAGTLSVSADANLGANGSPVAFNGGTLRVTGTGLANLDNHPIAGGALGGGIDVATAGHVFAINQALNGTGSLAKNGAGTLSLGAANNFDGALLINGGSVRLGNALGARFMTVTLNTPGATLDLNGFNATLGGLTGNQPLDLKGATVLVGNNNDSTTYAGAIGSSSGGGGVTKVGSGTLTLTGASTYAGPTTISGGTVVINALADGGSASSLGASTAAAANLVLDGGTLRYNGSGSATSTDRLFTLTPKGGTLDAGAAGLGQWRFLNTGAIAVTGSGDRTLRLTGGTSLSDLYASLGDPAGGGKTTLLKEGAGRWILSAPATPRSYSGDTIVSAGTLMTNNDNPLPFGPGKGNLSVASGATFEMNNRNLAVNGLTGAGTVNHRGNNSNKTLTIGHGDASASFSGVLSDVPSTAGSASQLHVVKVGSGTQTLAGSSTYEGVTTINGGVLAVPTLANGGVAGTLGASSSAATNLVLDGGTLRYTGSAATSNRLVTVGPAGGAIDASGSGGLTLNNVGAAVASGSGDRTLTLTGSATSFNNVYAAMADPDGGGKLALTKSGAGNWRIFGSAKTYSGDTTVDAGTLYLPVAGVLPFGAGKGDLVVNAGATLDMNGNSHSFNALVGAGTVTTTSNTTRTLTLGHGDASGHFSGTLTQGAAQTLNLAKTGTGTQTLGGVLAHRGSTAVNAGKLVLETNSTAGSAIMVDGGAAMELVQHGGRVIRTGAVSVSGSGRLDLRDNKLIVAGGNLAAVEALVATAYNGSAWDGGGITTSMPDAAAGLTTLAVATADQTGLSAFGGQSVAGGDVLVMYTYGGDTNFDGKLDADDYGTIDFSVLVAGSTGYYNGDFNFDGAINADDYGVIDFNILAQTTPFPTGGGADAPMGPAVVAVPEPSSLLATAAAIGATLTRRRR